MACPGRVAEVPGYASKGAPGGLGALDGIGIEEGAAPEAATVNFAECCQFADLVPLALDRLYLVVDDFACLLFGKEIGGSALDAGGHATQPIAIAPDRHRLRRL